MVRCGMYATLLRKNHLAGVLLGTGTGEALGMGFRRLSRRAILRVAGNRPIDFSYWPQSGAYGEHTRLMLVTAQALLNSHNELAPFQRALAWRLGWYPLSFPVGISAGTLWTCFKCRFRRFGVASGSPDSGRTEAATGAVFLSIALHGSGHRLANWVQSATRLTHCNSLTIDVCTFLAILMQTAATSRYRRDPTEGRLPQVGPATRRPILPLENPVAILEEAVAQTTTADMRNAGRWMGEALEARWSVARLANHLGWGDRVPDHIYPVAILASYAFLRHSGDYRRAVDRAIRLGGATAVLGAITGGLAGGYLGGDAIPSTLLRALRGGPHDRRWMLAMADRFSHWPHGVADLYPAPAQPSAPLMQIARNLSLLPAAGLQRCRRVLLGATTRSPRKAR